MIDHELALASLSSGHSEQSCDDPSQAEHVEDGNDGEEDPPEDPEDAEDFSHKGVQKSFRKEVKDSRDTATADLPQNKRKVSEVYLPALARNLLTGKLY